MDDTDDDADDEADADDGTDAYIIIKVNESFG
jgi:hypothetical protein